MNILIYEIEITGHHSEFISHLVNHIYKSKPDDFFTFILHPKFSLTFPVIAEKIKNHTNIQFIEISENDYDSVKTKSSIKNSIIEYKLMNNYAQNYGVKKVYLLTFNSFQLALGLYNSKYEISGILFMPFFRMQRITLKEKLNFVRKYLQTWLYLRNNSLKRIFILNDNKSIVYLNEVFKTNKFQMLPDPVPRIEPSPEFSLRKNFKIDAERKIILHFGSLSERKGTLELLSSFDYLNSNTKQKIALLIIGKASVDFDKLINNKILSIQQLYPETCLIYKNEYVSDSLMKCYFEQCDLVLIPYKTGESSSGIIGHSNASRKPVIATNKGLLGDLVKNNNLGLLIEESSPDLISKAIQTFMDNPIEFNKSDEYLITHSPTIFARTIFEG